MIVDVFSFLKKLCRLLIETIKTKTVKKQLVHLLLVFLIGLTSCKKNPSKKIEEEINSEIKKTAIPAVVMGKVHKNGKC